MKTNNSTLIRRIPIVNSKPDDCKYPKEEEKRETSLFHKNYNTQGLPNTQRLGELDQSLLNHLLLMLELEDIASLALVNKSINKNINFKRGNLDYKAILNSLEQYIFRNDILRFIPNYLDGNITSKEIISIFRIFQYKPELRHKKLYFYQRMFMNQVVSNSRDGGIKIERFLLLIFNAIKDSTQFSEVIKCHKLSDREVRKLINISGDEYNELIAIFKHSPRVKTLTTARTLTTIKYYKYKILDQTKSAILHIKLFILLLAVLLDKILGFTKLSPYFASSIFSNPPENSEKRIDHYYFIKYIDKFL